MFKRIPGTRFFSNLAEIGILPTDDFFDSRLKRAVNMLSITSAVCVLLSAPHQYFIQLEPTGLYILFSLPFYLLTIWLNKINKPLFAITALFITSSLFLTVSSIRYGQESFTHCHYVSILYGTSLLYNKDKARNYFYFNLIFTIITVVFVLSTYHYNWFSFLKIQINDPALKRRFNFIILAFSSLVFSLIIVSSYLFQRKEIMSSLAEQKTLLAELNHRVKNNLAIIIGLLNLKREASENEEAKEALKDCRDRVMSMSLVHQKMYQNGNKNYIEIKPYAEDLVAEIKNSFPMIKNLLIETTIDEIRLNVATAIPLGLVLNELITNCFKHAFKGITNPKIVIQLAKASNNMITLILKDNGVGFEKIQNKSHEGLGLELISSLCAQIEGKHSFYFNGGSKFTVTFPNNPK